MKVRKKPDPIVGNMRVCVTCRYPYKKTLGGCPNPACPANPDWSEERRAKWAREKARSTTAKREREALARARRQSFGRGR